MRRTTLLSVLLSLLLSLCVSCIVVSSSSLASAAAASASAPSLHVPRVLASDSTSEEHWLSADSIEYADETVDGEAENMLETGSDAATPRLLRPSEFAAYFASLTPSAASAAASASVSSDDSAFVETRTRSKATLDKCKQTLNSWLHKCIV